MMTVTDEDGRQHPWETYRQLGPDGPTNENLNADCLAPLSREHGQCLCIHPMAGVINFSGLSCKWCDQLVKDDGLSLEDAKRLRTAAILAMYPQLAKGV